MKLNYLKSRLSYSTETGEFVWIKTNRSDMLHKTAGYKTNQGYIHIELDGIIFQAHRLAWFYHKGEWPKEMIDHIDGNKANNKIENLREASRSQNRVNSPNSWAKSCTKGVYKNGPGWTARIRKDGKLYNLGTYKTIEEANEIYIKSALELYGEFARLDQDH